MPATVCRQHWQVNICKRQCVGIVIFNDTTTKNSATNIIFSVVLIILNDSIIILNDSIIIFNDSIIIFNDSIIIFNDSITVYIWSTYFVH